MSPIENALYGTRRVHGVVEFELTPKTICLRVAPWEEPASWAQAVFCNAAIISLDQYADETGELDLPWDIIGFDSSVQSTGRWKFVLHCAAIEWCFESDWPVIERNAMG